MSRDGEWASADMWIGKAVRFAVTGVAATMVHVLIAFVCIRFAAWHPAMSNALAAIGASVFSYIVHTLWSFSEAIHARNMVRFSVVSLSVCGLSALIAAIAEAFGFPYWVGIVLVVCTVPMVSFSAHYFWTYRS